MNLPSVRPLVRSLPPLAVVWAIIIAVAGIVFQAGVSWQRLGALSDRVVVLESQAATVQDLRIEIARLQYAITSLTAEVSRMASERRT